MTMGEFNVNGRSELLSAIGAGTIQDRRRHMVHLARNDLHERATHILAACYVYSLNSKERPQNKISSATMDTATKLLGHVLAELICLHDFNIRMGELVERVAKASQTSSYSEKRIKIYINSALRLLAVFEILKPYERGRGRLQYQRGDLTKILYVYDVDLDNWQCAPFSMGAEEVSINVIEPTLASLTSDQLAIVTKASVKDVQRTAAIMPDSDTMKFGFDVFKALQRNSTVEWGADLTTHEPASLSAQQKIAHLEKCIADLEADNTRLKVQMDRLEKLQLPSLCNYLTWPPSQ